MSWVPTGSASAVDLDRVFGECPELYGTFADLYDAVWDGDRADPLLLELCRLRMAQIIGSRFDLGLRYRVAREAGLTEDLVAALPSWPHSEAFDGAQRACLDFAEQFLLDAKALTDDQAAAVVAHLTEEGFVAFTVALGLFEGLQRWCVLLDVEPLRDGPVVVGGLAPHRRGTPQPLPR